jgi:hypothetical protein
MVDRFEIIHKDVEKYGLDVVLEAVALAIFRVSQGLYDEAIETVLKRHDIAIAEPIGEELFVDGKGQVYKIETNEYGKKVRVYVP